jgi:uncharacterized protein
MRRLGRFYLGGDAEGPALVLSEALSFWGGVEAETGRIIDHSHPDLGKTITGFVLVMPSGRGSSSSSSVLAETIRRGTGPVAIVIARPDPILTVGALVAQSLYDRTCPIVVCVLDGLATGDRLRISRTAAGEAEVRQRQATRPQ